MIAKNLIIVQLIISKKKQSAYKKKIHVSYSIYFVDDKNPHVLFGRLILYMYTFFVDRRYWNLDIAEHACVIYHMIEKKTDMIMSTFSENNNFFCLFHINNKNIHFKFQI